MGRRSVDLEELCVARQTKRHELDTLTATGRELTADSMTTDKHCLRDAVSDLRARWRELMQLLTNTVSSAVSVAFLNTLLFILFILSSVAGSKPMNTEKHNHNTISASCSKSKCKVRLYYNVL